MEILLILVVFSEVLAKIRVSTKLGELAYSWTLSWALMIKTCPASSLAHLWHHKIVHTQVPQVSYPRMWVSWECIYLLRSNKKKVPLVNDLDCWRNILPRTSKWATFDGLFFARSFFLPCLTPMRYSKSIQTWNFKNRQSLHQDAFERLTSPDYAIIFAHTAFVCEKSSNLDKSSNSDLAEHNVFLALKERGGIGFFATRTSGEARNTFRWTLRCFWRRRGSEALHSQRYFFAPYALTIAENLVRSVSTPEQHNLWDSSWANFKEVRWYWHRTQCIAQSFPHLS